MKSKLRHHYVSLKNVERDAGKELEKMRRKKSNRSWPNGEKKWNSEGRDNKTSKTKKEN